MLNNRKYIKLILSTLLLGLLLFLSCDDRNPVVAPPPIILYELNFDIERWQDVEYGTTELIIFPKQLK